METDNIISPDVAVLANNSGSTIFHEIRTFVDEIVQTNICVPVAQQSSISPQDSEFDLSEPLIAPDQSRLIRNYEDNSGTGIYHDNQFNFELQTWIHDGSTVHISTVELCEGSKIITSTGYLLQLSPKIPLNITWSGPTFEIAKLTQATPYVMFDRSPTKGTIIIVPCSLWETNEDALRIALSCQRYHNNIAGVILTLPDSKSSWWNWLTGADEPKLFQYARHQIKNINIF